ncbi:MAG: DUF72 domain-containing protein [bacterium]
MVKVYIGTSGWFYHWNPERTLDWYVAESRLNAVELNASFYRFPFPNQVKSWAEKGRGLRWAVKISRLVTHVHRLGARAYEVWQRFFELFAPLDKLVDFYLLQLHPALDTGAQKKVEKFFEQTGLGKRLALECRNPDWFTPKTEGWAGELGLTLVSVDAPAYPRTIFNTSGQVYLRMHGRSGWYQHNYSAAELREIRARILEQAPTAAYIFFNNDQEMLANARQLVRIFRRDAGN